MATDQSQAQHEGDRTQTEKPDITDDHKEKAQEMRKEYVEDRATVIMPGSGGTVAGTAVNEWIDEDGNPKYGDTAEGSPGDKSDGDEADGDTIASDKARNEKILKAKAEDDAAKDGD
jgi:hypothetical protein